MYLRMDENACGWALNKIIIFCGSFHICGQKILIDYKYITNYYQLANIEIKKSLFCSRLNEYLISYSSLRSFISPIVYL